jgi:propanediol dehydratase large subunit
MQVVGDRMQSRLSSLNFKHITNCADNPAQIA